MTVSLGLILREFAGTALLDRRLNRALRQVVELHWLPGPALEDETDRDLAHFFAVRVQASANWRITRSAAPLAFVFGSLTVPFQADRRIYNSLPVQFSGRKPAISPLRNPLSAATRIARAQDRIANLLDLRKGVRGFTCKG